MKLDIQISYNFSKLFAKKELIPLFLNNISIDD